MKKPYLKPEMQKISFQSSEDLMDIEQGISATKPSGQSFDQEQSFNDLNGIHLN